MACLYVCGGSSKLIASLPPAPFLAVRPLDLPLQRWRAFVVSVLESFPSSSPSVLFYSLQGGTRFRVRLRVLYKTHFEADIVDSPGGLMEHDSAIARHIRPFGAPGTCRFIRISLLYRHCAPHVLPTAPCFKLACKLCKTCLALECSCMLGSKFQGLASLCSCVKVVLPFCQLS